MGKMKNLKKKLSLKPAEKEKNPFDFLPYTQNHHVTGQRIPKHQQGKFTGLSEVTKKSQELLLQQYTNRGRSNTFLDKRIGQYNKNMSHEDKIIARINAINRKQPKASVYNLNDSEVLTHLGKPIFDIDKYDNPVSDSAEGKQRKYEKRVEKAAELTEKLDQKRKTVQSLISKYKRNSQPVEKSSYDSTVQEMKFEARTRAKDPIKSPEEIEKEEKEKRKKLEAERKMRMLGPLNKVIMHQRKHVSADDLDDGLQLEENLPVSDSNSDENEDYIFRKETDSDHGDDQKHSSEDSDCNNEEDSYSDLQSDDDDDEMQYSHGKEAKQQESSEKHINKLSEFYKEIPDIGNFDEFCQMMSGCENQQINVILEKLIKGCHPSLKEENSSYLSILFSYLFRYLIRACEDEEVDIEVLNPLTPHLFDISHFVPNDCARTFLDIFYDKYKAFQQQSQNKRRRVPRLGTLILFKVAGILYSTTDILHPVITPSMLFMSQILSSCKFSSAQDIVGGLFVCFVWLEYVSISKRYVPEVIYFLKLVLEKFTQQDMKCFSEIEENKHDSQSKMPLSLLKNVSVDYDNAETFYIILKMSLHVVHEFALLYKPLPSFLEIFSFCEKVLPVLKDKGTEDIKKSADCILSLMKSKEKRAFLVQERKKPKPLKFLEPKFDYKFTTKRKHQTGNPQKLEQDRIKRKNKRELKGAIRKLRQDNRFLAAHQFREQERKDSERKQKVNQIYHDLAVQESEYKKMKRKKK